MIKSDAFLPITFGTITGGTKGYLIGMITASGIIQVVVYAAVGAIVGWFLKLLLDKIKIKWDNYQLKLKSEFKLKPTNNKPKGKIKITK